MNSTLSDQDLNSNTNLSYINLGECETTLKNIIIYMNHFH